MLTSVCILSVLAAMNQWSNAYGLDLKNSRKRALMADIWTDRFHTFFEVTYSGNKSLNLKVQR